MTSDRIELTEEARADLRDVLGYIVERNPAAAENLRSAIERTVAALALTAPRMDGVLVGLRDGSDARRVYVHPVAIVYEREPGVLRVLRVYHHAREPIAR